MKVGFKLFASLAEHLPDGHRGNRIELEVATDTTIADLITRFRVPERSAHLVLVNGVFVPPGERLTHGLADGDEVAIWPPIAGG